VPPGLEAACLKALAKSPDDRYATAAELGREVQSWQDRERRKAEDELRQAGRRLMRQQAALVALTRNEVFAAGNVEATFRKMIEVAAQTIGVERVSIWRYSEDRQAIRCQLLYELSSGQYTSGLELRAESFPSYFEALTTSEVIAAHDARHDPRTREFTESYLKPLSIGAIMDAPIHIEGAMRGVVCHEHIGPPRTWMPDEQLFAIAIANLVAQTISQWERR
jgi:GAF domain-containing protein